MSGARASAGSRDPSLAAAEGYAKIPLSIR